VFSNLMRLSRPAPGWVWIGVALTAVATQLPLSNSFPQGAAFLLLWIWPMWSWSSILRGPRFERWLTAAALSLLLNALLALIVHYLPGPISAWMLLLSALLVIGFPLVLRKPLRQGEAWPKWPRLLPFLLIIFLAFGLRFANLGYKEFQGDEGIIMVRAAAAITGNDANLLLHQKGPIEILVPLTSWSITGQINEFWSRLPFTWASVLTVVAVTFLAGRWFNWRVALIASALFAVTGFGIAFGRIIQYQSFVMLWGTMALFHATRYRHSAHGEAADLWLTALFLSGGLLAHYDTVLVVPAAAWLVLSRLWAERTVVWQEWLGATLLGTAVLALFYVPFFLSPNFTRTLNYLMYDRVGANTAISPARWSGPAVWQMVTFYNSTYTIVGLVLLILIGLAYLWQQRSHFAAVLHLLAPLIFYVGVTVDPRTHVYTLFPGATILAAIGGDYLWRQNGGRRHIYRSCLMIAAGVLFVLVSAFYTYFLYVDVTNERVRTWDESRPPGYWTSWQQAPRYGLFGFPYQAGWRVVADLPGLGDGWYASNEKAEVTRWYTSHSPRTHCANFDTFILAENVQDEIPYDQSWLDETYLRYQISVRGNVKMRIYTRQPVESTQMIAADGAAYWLRPRDAAPPRTGGLGPVNAILGERVQLVGYDLNLDNPTAGGSVTLVLYWRALAPFDRNFQVFTHLYDGQMWGQNDSAPDCAINPTTRWEPGQIIADSHIIPISEEVLPGQIPLYVGMYDLLTYERLVVQNTPDNAIYLTDVTILP
jgi:hypothetical protein